MERMIVLNVLLLLVLPLVCGHCLAWGGPESFFSVRDLPLIREGIQTHQFCSYDRAGDNYDWQYFPLYTESDGEVVIFDAMGPGCLYRHHINLWRGICDGINVRYYLDDEKQPRVDMDVSTFFSEKNPLGIFRYPLAVDGKSDFRVMYCPMYFKKRLKVTLSREPGGPGTVDLPWTGRADKIPDAPGRWHWYNYTYHTLSEDPGLESWRPGQDQSKLLALWDTARLGQDPKQTEGNKEASTSADLPAGKSLSLPELTGQGSISSLRVSIDPPSEEVLFNTWIKITWDGKPQPQVEAPLGAFFGVYRTKLEASFKSLLLGYSPSGMYCYFPMPFWKSAKIEIENRGKDDIKSIGVVTQYDLSQNGQYPPKGSGYFFARYERERPRKEGVDYTYLRTNGKGHVVGHTAARYGTSMEEDERTYFDDSRTPQIYGEGYEDDHNMGWGLRDLQHAIFGAFAADGGAGSVYRFYIPDHYFFESAIKHGHQVYGPNSPLGHEGMYTVGDEESVTFYYAQESPGLALTDELDVGDSASEAKHNYQVIGARKDKTGSFWYDGEFNNVLLKAPAIVDSGVSFDGSSTFTASIDPANRGVRLRRRTDKENNRQMGRVYVDGVLVKTRPWYSVDYEKTYRGIRWQDTDFEIPAAYTKSKSSITVKIEFVSSKNNAWDEYYYWVYSYR